MTAELDNKKEIALRYLKANLLLHAGMIFSVQGESAQILYAGTGGVLLWDAKGRVHMLSAAGYEQGLIITALLENVETLLVHQQFMVEYLCQKYRLGTVRECEQAVYPHQKPLPLRGSLEIKRLGREYLPVVLAHYHTVDDPQYVEDLLQDGALYGGFVAGELCGFVGCHPEGALGLLEVFPEYRRRGYAGELESFMVNRVLAAGQIPYGHVFADNTTSLSLQAKLGFKFCPQKVYWIF